MCRLEVGRHQKPGASRVLYGKRTDSGLKQDGGNSYKGVDTGT